MFHNESSKQLVSSTEKRPNLINLKHETTNAKDIVKFPLNFNEETVKKLIVLN